MKRLLPLALALVILLSACQAPNPQPTLEVTNTEVEAVIPTLPSTSTAVPVTVTPTPTATVQPTPTVTPLPQSYGPNGFPAQVNPLTGLPVTNPQLLERRPLAVKIQIFPRGQRPPWGVSLADIVYEYYQNNGLTRFHAVFYGNDAEQIGPIRSARLPDMALVRMYKSNFAFGGADQRILSQLFATEFANRLIVEGNRCPPMCRIDPNTYNYLITNTSDMSSFITSQGIANGRQVLDGMRFEYAPPAAGEPASQVQVRYSISAYVHWIYDAASGKYLRFQDTQEDNGQGEAVEPLTDRLNNQQLSADNVVVLQATHSYVLQTGANEIVDITLQGNGPAYLFRDGQVYKVFWSRSGLDELITLTNPDGTPFPFKNGITWFQVVGTSSLFTRQEQAGIWRFENRIP